MSHLVAGLIIAVVLVAACSTMWGLVVVFEEAGPILGIPVTIVAITLWVAAGLFVVDRVVDEDTSRHQWDGGSGPDTVCHYEIDHRIIPAGKVMVPTDELVTVCVDAPKSRPR